MLGFSLDAGMRFHPVLILYSAWVAGADDTGDYLTFSGLKVGYQHTLHEWFAAYGAIGFGRARYHLDDGTSSRGSATTFDVGVAVVKERAVNVLSVGAQVVVPSASGLPPGSRLDGISVYFVATVNPLLLLLAN
jgi:hypothetical protein